MFTTIAFILFVLSLVLVYIGIFITACKAKITYYQFTDMKTKSSIWCTEDMLDYETVKEEIEKTREKFQ